METAALLLIIFSAFTHACWNLLVKQSRDKTVFIWWMFVGSWSLMTLLTLILDLFPILSWHMLGLAVVSAICFVFYHWLGGYAYREGDLSVTYPLAQTAMLYVPLWGVLFLGESLSLVGLAGIALIVVGAYCIQLRGLSAVDFLRPFSQFGTRSVQAALLAGFSYSIGAVIDKSGVDQYGAYRFTYVMVFFVLIFMTLNLMRSSYRGRVMEEWRLNAKQIMLAGPVVLASFLSFRLGLELAPVSYAVPARRVSLLIGVLIGIIFLKESFGRIRLISATLILAGVVLIWAG